MSILRSLRNLFLVALMAVFLLPSTGYPGGQLPPQPLGNCGPDCGWLVWQCYGCCDYCSMTCIDYRYTMCTAYTNSCCP